MRVLAHSLIALQLLASSPGAQVPVERSVPATVTFHFDWPGSSPATYSIQLQSDGFGLYWEGQPYFNVHEAVDAKRISVSPDFVRKVMLAVPTIKAGSCETHIKHLAQTGRKTLVFNMAGSSAKCEFNYSDDEKVNSAVSVLQAIAEMIDYGSKLEHAHRFDRLGLDAEMDSLTAEAKDGRAIELQNIAPVLNAIVNDERVIERARRKADRLLQDASPSPAASPSESSPR